MIAFFHREPVRSMLVMSNSLITPDRNDQHYALYDYATMLSVNTSPSVPFKQRQSVLGVLANFGALFPFWSLCFSQYLFLRYGEPAVHFLYNVKFVCSCFLVSFLQDVVLHCL